MAQEADVRPVLRAVIGQLDVWWWGAVTMRMAGLTDDEFFWKPVPDAHCLQRRDGQLFCDWPPGSQGEAIPPVTTIAWRMAHIAQGCFESRWHTYFGDGPLADWQELPFVDNAADALAYLEDWKAKWCAALVAAGEDGLWREIGPNEYNTEIMQLGDHDPFIGVVMHLNREVMHHGAEICLLRDLYRATQL
jgi:hypothetical protein